MGGSHTAPDSKFPPQVRRANNTDDPRRRSQGHSNTAVMPSTVPGQSKCMSNSALPSGDGKFVVSGEHRSITRKLYSDENTLGMNLPNTLTALFALICSSNPKPPTAVSTLRRNSSLGMLSSNLMVTNMGTVKLRVLLLNISTTTILEHGNATQKVSGTTCLIYDWYYHSTMIT